MVFRGTGERITEIEKEGYHKDVLVLWQKKAWLDRPTCNTWANYFSEYVQELPEKIKAYRATASGGRGEFTMPKNEKNMENQNESMGKSLSSLLLVDNLDGQCQPEFATNLKQSGGCLTWRLPPGCTDLLQPVDCGVGQVLRNEVGRQLDLWRADDDNLERWEGSLTSAERRVLMTEWVGKAWKVVLHDRKKLLWRSFEKTGMLLRADKQCEDKICPEGLTGSYKFHEALNPQPPRSGVMPSSRWEGGAQRKTKVILTVNEEMEVEKLGMHFGEVGTPPHTLYVVAVSSSSPGARAGFIEGDQVVSADGKPMTCLQDFKNVYNTKDVDCDEITIEFQLRSLPSDEEAQIPTQNVQYPRQIDFEDSDLYTDDHEEACCEG